MTKRWSLGNFWPRHVCFAVLMTLSLQSAAVPIFDQGFSEPASTPTPQNPELERALTLIGQERWQEAERLTRDYLEQQPDSAPAYEILGTALALQGQLGDAVAALEKAVELAPKQATALTKLGDIALALEQPGLAMQYLQQAIEAVPDERRAHQRLGMIHEESGAVEAAITHYEQGIRGTPSAYLGVKLNLAQLYVHKGQFERATLLLAPWSTVDTGTQMTLRTLAAAHLGMQEADTAVRYLENAVELNESATVLIELGDALAASGDLEQAESRFREAADLSENPATALVRLANLQVSRERYDEAELAYKNAIEASPQDPSIYYGLGSLYGLTLRHNEAIEVYEAGLNFAPEAAPILRGIAVASLRIGNRTNALAYAEQLSEVSNNPSDLFLLGSLYEQSGNQDSALQTYQDVIELNEEFWPAHNNLAVIYLNRSDLDKAMIHSERAYQIAGRTAINAAHTFGLVLLHSGNNDVARAILENARDLSPEHVLTRYHLGIAYSELGNRENAITELEMALQLDSNFQYANDARALLDRL